MRHRLPLSGSPVTTHEDGWDGPRRALPWPAIALADTGRGLAALEFALALGEAAHELALPVRFRLLDFARTPALPRELGPRFAALGAVHAQHVDADAPVALDAGALELWLGLPSLLWLEPAFSILLGIDKPRLEWPPALRGVEVSLALAGPRPGLARALLEELNGRGVLPAGPHSVRYVR